MAKAKLVSVVIPIYNVDLYLAQCLDSLISQTYANLEFICVNDGSTDQSLDILLKYQSKDPRIHVIHQVNAGLSAARNMGMRAAQGEFICFVDSDDWCEVTMIEEMVAVLESTASNFVNCAMNCYDEQKKTFQKSNEYFSLGMFSNEQNRRKLTLEDLEPVILTFNVTACSKLFRHEFLINHQLYFKEGLVHEDEFFFLDMLPHIQSFAITKNYLYNYRINRAGSIMKTINLRWESLLTLYKYKYHILNQENLLMRDNHILYWAQFFNFVKTFLKEIKKKDVFYNRVRSFVLTKLSHDVILRESSFLRKMVRSMEKNSSYEQYSLDIQDRRFGIFKEKSKEKYVCYSIFGIRFLKKDYLENYYLADFSISFLNKKK